MMSDQDISVSPNKTLVFLAHRKDWAKNRVISILMDSGSLEKKDMTLREVQDLFNLIDNTNEKGEALFELLMGCRHSFRKLMNEREHLQVFREYAKDAFDTYIYCSLALSILRFLE